MTADLITRLVTLANEKDLVVGESEAWKGEAIDPVLRDG